MVFMLLMMTHCWKDFGGTVEKFPMSLKENIEIDQLMLFFCLLPVVKVYLHLVNFKEVYSHRTLDHVRLFDISKVETGASSGQVQKNVSNGKDVVVN